MLVDGVGELGGLGERRRAWASGGGVGELGGEDGGGGLGRATSGSVGEAAAKRRAASSNAGMLGRPERNESGGGRGERRRNLARCA